MTDQEGTSKSANQRQRDRIAAVNHWRGQCLDSFARIEQAIIRCSEAILPHTISHPFKIEEAAAKRTQALRDTLATVWPKLPAATKLNGLLDLWSIREKERNDLVHGKFTVRAGVESDWQLINELVAVKKGVVLSRRDLVDQRQALAFLDAVQAERNRLEEAIGKFAASFEAD
jgi:hypothetical protein